MSLQGVDPPQGNKIIRALNRGGGFPQLQLIPPQGFGGGVIPPGFIAMLFETGETMLYEDNSFAMAYEAATGIPADWFDTNYKKRIPLTIKASQVPEPETDLHQLVNGTFPDLIGNVQSAGQDIRFAKADKVELKYEIEEIDALTGKLVVWFKNPAVVVGDEVFMYFANPTAIDNQDKNAVWNVNNITTWHMSQTPPSLILDSTANANNATPTNMGPSEQIAGKINGTLQFNNLDDLEVTSSSMDAALRKNFSIMGWINLDALVAGFHTLLGRLLQMNCGVTGNGTQLYILFSGLAFKPKTISPAININEDHHIAFTFSDATTNLTITYYLDGVSQGTETINQSNLGTGSWFVGMTGEGSTDFNGKISEIQVYDTELTADRIESIYNNENDLNTYFDVGAVENI